jgi:hypothetical protein
MRATAVAAIVLGTTIWTPSFAETDAMDADVSCIVSIGMLPQINQKAHLMSDELAQQTTLMGSMYFLGKITGRDPKFDIENALVEKLAQLDNSAISSALTRCGGELQEQGGRWQTIGKHMIERAKDQGDPPKL